MVGVGRDGTGCAVAAAACAGSAVAVGARCVVLEVRSVSAWVVHEPAVVSEAKASEVACVVAIAAVVVAVVGAVSIVAHWLIFDDAAGVVEVVAGSLLLRLRFRVSIAVTYA